MGYFDDQDRKKAERMTRREMFNDRLKGKKWKDSYDYGSDFGSRFKENLKLLKYSPILVVVVIAGIIIYTETHPDPVCSHYIDDYGGRIYNVHITKDFQKDPVVTLEGVCPLCEVSIKIPQESSTVIGTEPPTCETGTKTYYRGKFVHENREYQTEYYIIGSDYLLHDYSIIISEEVQPTCEEAGHYIEYACSRCDKHSGGNEIPALGHEVEHFETKKEPTCQEEGREVGSYCSRCDKTLEGYEVIPTIPCNYNDVLVEPTYTTSGYNSHTCSMCNNTYYDNHVKALVYNKVELEEIDTPSGRALSVKKINSNCKDSSIVIPSNVDGLDVVSIEARAFENCDFLESIELPSTISTIEGGVFANCTSLTTINIPDKVKTLQYGTFRGCTALKNIDINKVETIEENAFLECKNLNSIVLPTSVTSVHENAFKDCIRMVEIYDLNNKFSSSYPSSVISINTDINDPSRIEIFGENECVRDNSNKLYLFNVNPNTSTYNMPKLINDEEYEILPYSLNKTKECNSVTISKISSYPFKQLIADSSSYTYESYPVPHIGFDLEEDIPTTYFHDTFEYTLEKLTIINLKTKGIIDSINVQEIEMPILFDKLSELFYSGVLSYDIKKITFTSGTILPDEYCKNVNSLQVVTLPSELEEIGEEAFYDCENLYSIDLGDNLKNIGRLAFYSCPSINPTFPETLLTIGEGAFRWCSSLQTVVIPKNVVEIGNYAFADCYNIDKVYNLSSLVIYPKNHNYGSVALNVYYVYSSLEEEEKVFYEEDGIYVLMDDKYYLAEWKKNEETVVLPDFYKGENYYFYPQVFINCDNIRHLTLGSGVVEINEKTFYNHGFIETIIMKDNVRVIGDNAFNGCSSLKSITLSKSLESIGIDAFLECGIDYSQDRVVKYNGDVTSWSNIEFSNSQSTPMCFADKILFKDNNTYSPVTSISIVEGTTSINPYQFYGFRDVISLYIPNSVITIGNNAFGYLSSLKYAEMPARSGLKVSSLEEVAISSNIPDSYFGYMSNLKKVTVLDGVEYIGNNAFKNCSSLEEVIISKTVTSIGETIFDSNGKLKTLSVDKDNPSYKALEEGFGLVDKTTKTLIFGNETSVLSDDILHIGDNAFYNNKNVTTMNIPSSIQSIGNYAFYNCVNLEEITLNNNITSIGDYAFYRCLKITSVDFVTFNKLTYIGTYAFNGCNNIEVISLPESLESIGLYAFSKCKISEITMPILGQGIVQLFGTYDSMPTNLTTINILSGDVPKGYFSSCKNVTTINLNKVTNIGEEAFRFCSSLVNISIPEGTETIGNSAFDRCSSLEKISLPDSLTSLGASAFAYCTNLLDITIPKSLKVLYSSTFYSCTSLTKVSYQDGCELEEVCPSVFYGCTSLKELTIPSSVTIIWVGALQGLSSLEKLTISNLEYKDTYRNETTIYYLFDELGYNSIPSTLKEINLPYVTSIPAKAFINCSSITKITLSEGLTTIGSQAFYNCTNLKEINFPSTLESIGSDAFSNTNIDESLIPNI